MTEREQTTHSTSGRDATVAAILGLFFVVLGLPVAFGALTASLPIDRLLSAAAAASLFAIGGLFLWAGRNWRRTSS